MATKLSVACPKTPSKVRVLGAREVHAPTTREMNRDEHQEQATREDEENERCVHQTT